MSQALARQPSRLRDSRPHGPERTAPPVGPAPRPRNTVRRARLMAELTQAELAAAVGVTRQTIVAVEAGDYAPSVYLALAIADRLSSTVESTVRADGDRDRR